LHELGGTHDFPGVTEAAAVTFDITSVLHMKMAAIRAHTSQTSDLIDDDPGGFRLSEATIGRLAKAHESYWRAFE
jgi:hypothetical protein